LRHYAKSGFLERFRKERKQALFEKSAAKTFPTVTLKKQAAGPIVL
jgi:hypothetical protein